MGVLTVTVLFVVCFVCAVTCQHSETSEELNEVEDEGNWRVVYKVVSDCSHREDIMVCLKMKAVNFMDKALSMKTPLPITDYLSLSVDPSTKEETSGDMKTDQVLSEAQLEESLPRSLDEKSSSLDTMLQQRVDKFLDSRTVQFTIPKDILEGRVKKDKGGGMIMAAGLAFAGMMAQVVMGKIALIAGKALIVAKVALVLSAVIGLKKLVSGGGGGGESHQVVYASEHGGGWGHRSLDADGAAHDLAYSAHSGRNNKLDESPQA
uniref:Uncharacterized protein n=1 Tax=Timema shepardi TaxID=629360 RepID=A0A7R9B468_TIMSH|nr:unnamed protein product [Timema shepardi]